MTKANKCTVFMITSRQRNMCKNEFILNSHHLLFRRLYVSKNFLTHQHLFKLTFHLTINRMIDNNKLNDISIIISHDTFLWVDWWNSTVKFMWLPCFIMSASKKYKSRNRSMSRHWMLHLNQQYSTWIWKVRTREKDSDRERERIEIKQNKYNITQTCFGR